MRNKDIIEKHPDDFADDNQCTLCKLHELAYEDLPEIIKCPLCGHEHHELEILGTTVFLVVGETNGSPEHNPDEVIDKYMVFRCAKCRGHIALIPHAVLWNANHDVHYTGGKHYIPEMITNDIREIAQKQIDQFLERQKNGDNLDSWSVAQWIAYELEEYIATKLYDAGRKH